MAPSDSSWCRIKLGCEIERLLVAHLRSNKVTWIAGSVLLFALLVLGATHYGSQFFLYYRVRRALPGADSYGHLSTIPRPLVESGESLASGTSLSYFGCRFEVPWQEIVLERNEGRWAEVQFKTGQTVKVSNPNEFYVHGFISDYLGNSSIWETALKEGFPASKYDQFKAVLSSSPSQLSPFQSRPTFARTLVLISQKGLYFEHNPLKPEIFSFERPNLRGFEVSGIAQKMEEATLTFFDPTDRMFTVRIRGGQNSNLNQSEINRVIYSFSVSDDPIPVPSPKRD
jgi:hypothetical protein